MYVYSDTLPAHLCRGTSYWYSYLPDDDAGVAGARHHALLVAVDGQRPDPRLVRVQRLDALRRLDRPQLQ